MFMVKDFKLNIKHATVCIQAVKSTLPIKLNPLGLIVSTYIYQRKFDLNVRSKTTGNKEKRIDL